MTPDIHRDNLLQIQKRIKIGDEIPFVFTGEEDGGFDNEPNKAQFGGFYVLDGSLAILLNPIGQASGGILVNVSEVLIFESVPGTHALEVKDGWYLVLHNDNAGCVSAACLDGPKLRTKIIPYNDLTDYRALFTIGE